MFRKLVTSLALLCFGSLTVHAADAPIQVKVGASGLTFTPNNFTASNGTVVTFLFSGMHSVTQTTFPQPCVHKGFNSGRMNSGDSFTFTVTDDATPIWFYCNVGSHCGTGMVGAINAPATGNTFDAFLASARALGSTEPPQTDATTPVSTGAGVSIGAASATSGRSTATASSPAASSTKKSASSKLSSNAGVTIVGGALALLAVAV